MIVFSDEMNHASMIAGIRHAGCEKRIFRHNDLAHLEQLIGQAEPAAPKLIAFETVYSMDPDIEPNAAIGARDDKKHPLTHIRKNSGERKGGRNRLRERGALN